MRNLLALVVFIILQILFIPLTIIGAVWVGYKQHVTFVETDFSQENWFSTLTEAGYDETKPTIFFGKESRCI